MNWFLSAVFLAVAVYVPVELAHIDKQYCAFPLENGKRLIIRADGRGDGIFASRRSGGRTHNGVDLYAPVGTPVLAIRSGVVERAGEHRGMGKFVVIAHKDSLRSIYGHLSSIAVATGESVRQGQRVGAVGKTGNAAYRDMQPHLHLEIRRENAALDPMEFLP